MSLVSTAYIGLGSNLKNPQEQIQSALQNLNLHPGIQVDKTSGLWCSKPLGPQDQPDFINAVTRVNTSLCPDQLLVALKSIEQRQNRIKDRHWGPRTIDLDILLFDDISFSSKTLTIPHIEMTLRNFVLLPLQQLAPNTLIKGKTLGYWIDRTDLSLISEFQD